MFIIIIIIVTIIIVSLINISSCHNSILHPLRLKLEAFITNNQPRTENFIPLIPLTVFSHCCSAALICAFCFRIQSGFDKSGINTRQQFTLKSMKTSYYEFSTII